jgi:hypothetical protein
MYLRKSSRLESNTSCFAAFPQGTGVALRDHERTMLKEG